MSQKDSSFTIQPLTDSDRPWVAQLICEHWGGEQVVTRGKVYTPAELPGFIAWMNGQRAGLLTYHIEGESCEVMTLDSLQKGLGVGTQLIEAVKKGLRLGEVPIEILKRKHGKSKKGKDWLYGFHFAKIILKTWWR